MQENMRLSHRSAARLVARAATHSIQTRACSTTTVHTIQNIDIHLPNIERPHEQARPRVAKLSQGLGQHGCGDGTSSVVWHSARVLSEHLASEGSLPAAPYVEVGAGLGLCGLTLAKLVEERKEHSGSPELPLVYQTDGDDEAVALLQSTAIFNGIGHLIRAHGLEWGNRQQTSALLDQLDEPPGLVIGSDVLYDINAIPALVETIAQLGAPLTLIAFPPRHPGIAGGSSCREMEGLEQHAAKHGLRVELLKQRATLQARPSDEQQQDPPRDPARTSRWVDGVWLVALRAGGAEQPP